MPAIRSVVRVLSPSAVHASLEDIVEANMVLDLKREAERKANERE